MQPLKIITPSAMIRYKSVETDTLIKTIQYKAKQGKARQGKLYMNIYREMFMLENIKKPLPLRQYINI
jgi:hypothetical protein